MQDNTQCVAFLRVPQNPAVASLSELLGGEWVHIEVYYHYLIAVSKRGQGYQAYIVDVEMAFRNELSGDRLDDLLHEARLKLQAMYESSLADVSGLGTQPIE